VELAVVAFCKDDIDERAEVEKKVDVVVVEDERNGITIAGFEETDGLEVGVGAATEEWSIEVAINGGDVDT
jgi:hypothetical protein